MFQTFAFVHKHTRKPMAPCWCLNTVCKLLHPYAQRLEVIKCQHLVSNLRQGQTVARFTSMHACTQAGHRLMHSHMGCVTTLTQKFQSNNLHRLLGRGCCQNTKFEQRKIIFWKGNYGPCHAGFIKTCTLTGAHVVPLVLKPLNLPSGLLRLSCNRKLLFLRCSSNNLSNATDFREE